MLGPQLGCRPLTAGDEPSFGSLEGLLSIFGESIELQGVVTFH